MAEFVQRSVPANQEMFMMTMKSRANAPVNRANQAMFLMSVKAKAQDVTDAAPTSVPSTATPAVEVAADKIFIRKEADPEPEAAGVKAQVVETPVAAATAFSLEECRVRLAASMRSLPSPDELALGAVRRCLVSAVGCVDVAHASVQRLQPAQARSTRANFLQTLPELIGPPPNRSWRDEWAALSTEMLTMEEDSEIGQQLRTMSSEQSEQFIRTSHTYSLDAVLADGAPIVEELVNERGWARPHAQAYTMLYPLRAPLSRAVAERRSTFAASIYAISEALTEASAQLSGRGGGSLLPVYKHLHGPNGLLEADAAWASLEVPDRTGFRGLTSSALVVATRDRNCFTPHGFRNGTADDEGLPRYDLMDSDVVCFEAGPSDATAFHSPVMINDLFGALPPNTLFRLKRVVPPGEWEVAGVALEGGSAPDSPPPPGSPPFHTVRDDAAGASGLDEKRSPPGGGTQTTREKSRKTVGQDRQRLSVREKTRVNLLSAPAAVREVPATVRPNKRLLLVTCTFRPPTDPERPLAGQRASHGKFGVHVTSLHYGSREAYISGLDDILAQPALSLAQEFNRSFSWVDFEGDAHDLRSEWAYVTGVAAARTLRTGRRRDFNNDGKTVEDFLQVINERIVRRRGKASRSRRKDLDVSLVMLPEEHAFLNRDEVLAVRLYSGPAFQPINEFLRQIGNLTGDFRKQVAQNPRLTFASTVRHIVDAIRKLAAVTVPEEAARPLYRGVRGELPRAFWYEDKQGMITAVDAAFVSTSLSVETPVGYMQRGTPNVLWVLHPKLQSDAAYHRGADISLLSQFAHEKEILFPPCTMLIVQKPPGLDSFNARGGGEREEEMQTTYGSQLTMSNTVNMFLLSMTPDQAREAQHSQAMPAPATDGAKGERLDSAEENRRVFAVDEKADGKAYVKVHALPCFV